MSPQPALPSASVGANPMHSGSGSRQSPPPWSTAGAMHRATRSCQDRTIRSKTNKSTAPPTVTTRSGRVSKPTRKMQEDFASEAWSSPPYDDESAQAYAYVTK
ncbi:hypothetical protein HBI18_254560 [Parastagonospora nodorum]|nr:hypothetical protein HBH73_243590 [Parastagonospora nodorum]KAH5088848.1 hypothetical protein HBH72_240120 [Parastagonospora nodorum]KAH5097554.1 hypothetical protein HBH71_246130 [Parastagonospora nodorum]KAH5389764.1 hypothetical protein HBI32_247690 [Parastagonospora nodorum]KAH5449865.1 hypothetical protein HBI31_245060 [Parastagonospora nodorum]